MWLQEVMVYSKSSHMWCDGFVVEVSFSACRLMLARFATFPLGCCVLPLLLHALIPLRLPACCR